MVSKEEFRNYVEELIENNEELQNNIKSTNKKSSSAIFKSFTTIIVMLMFLSVVLMPVAIILIFVFAISEGAKNVKIQKIENKYKDKLVDFLLKDFEHSFDKNGGIDSIEYRNSPMYRYYDKYETEDFLRINLSSKNDAGTSCYMQLCDLHTYTQEIVENKGTSFGNNNMTMLNNHMLENDNSYETRNVTVFDGTFGFIDFKESFKTSLYINCASKFYNRGAQYVKLEDMSFNKKFSVYSNDQIESRYILNPRTMDLLDKLNDKVCGKASKFHRYLAIALVDNRMYFSFKGGFKLFGLNYKCKNPNEIFDDFYDDIDIILSLINEIKNNPRIFKI